MDQGTRRVAYGTGLVGVAVISLGCVLAGLQYRGADGEAFSILNQFVSELGNTVSSQGANWFNAALVIGSMCLALHLYCLALTFDKPLRSRLKALAIVGGLFGQLVGVFAMNVSPLHYVVAAVFFLALTLYIAFFTLDMLRTPRNPLHRTLLIMGSAMLVSVVVFLITGAVQFAQGNLLIMQPLDQRPAFTFSTTSEWVTLAALILWALLTSIHLLKASNLS